MKVEAGHWTREMIDNSVIDVVERYDVSQYGLVFEKQAIAFHLQHAFDLVERTLPKLISSSSVKRSIDLIRGGSCLLMVVN
jgi:hypothetical protein